MKNASDVLKFIKDKEAKFVDFRFTDTKGKMQHVTADVSCVDEGVFTDGYAFDGSSIAGWKSIEASDMTLMPDPATAHIDPFFAQTTVAIFCDVLEPSTGQPYERDPRSIAKKAEAYMMSLGIGDKVFFGPEAEFFIFDDVKFSTDMYSVGYEINSSELPTNTSADVETGNLGHRPRIEGRLLPGPADRQRPGHPFRDAVCSVGDGRRCRKAPPRGRCRSARTRREVRPDDHDGRPHADL